MKQTAVCVSIAVVLSVALAAIINFTVASDLRRQISEYNEATAQHLQVQDETLRQHLQELISLDGALGQISAQLSLQGNAVLDMQDQITLQQSTLLVQETKLATLYEAYRNLQRGILWSYGTGIPGVSKNELYTPHMVEDLGEGKLLIVEQSNCSVIVVDRETGDIVWQFGERGVAGTGNRLSSPHSARRIEGGPYEGHILITELEGAHRVLVIDFDTKEIVWETSAVAGPLDAIYWDDDHIMVSDWTANQITRIRLSDKAAVWSYTTPKPFYLQKLIKQEPDWWNYGNSYGGDLLFGTTSGYVAEIDTATASIVWQMGTDSLPTAPMLANQLYSPVRAFRYGCGENTSTMASAITIITDEGNARLLAVNREKQILWELGGVTLDFYNPIGWLIEPTYVEMSKAGNLLVSDGMANRIYELAYPLLPPVIGGQQFSSQIMTKDSLPATHSTTLEECGSLDFSNTRHSALTVACTYDSTATVGIKVHVFTSYDGINWDTAELLDSTGAPVFGDMPFTAGETVRKTMDVTSSATHWKVTVENLDTAVAVSEVSATVTVARY